MRKPVFILFIFLSLQVKSQTNLFDCATSRKIGFVHDAKDVFKQPSDTNKIDVFRYIQWYDCSNMTDDEYQEALFWIVPSDSVSFHLTYKHEDSARATLVFGISYPGLRLLSVQGTIQGALSSKGEWKIKGHLDLRLSSRLANKVIEQTIVLDDVYPQYKVVNRTDQHPLFGFYSGSE